MSESSMNRPSETDWKRVDEMTDEEVDTSDIQPLDERFFAKAELRMPDPKKASVTMRVDVDVLDWFKGHGEEYESLINHALHEYMYRHREQTR